MHHILVVEDGPSVGETLQISLEDVDGIFRVTSATNINEAFRVLGDDPPDAALIDAVLPDGSGFDLARTAIKLGVPALVISSYPEATWEIQEAGCSFLAKPFRPTVLIAKMQSLIEAAKARNTQLAISMHRLAEDRRSLDQAVEEPKRLVEMGRRRRERSKQQEE